MLHLPPRIRRYLAPTGWLPDTPQRGARLAITRHLAAERQPIARHRFQVSGLTLPAIFDWPFAVFINP